MVWIWKSYIVALCGKGFLYYQPWKGKEPGWVNLREGDLVRVYHTGGYNPQLHTLEALLDPVAAHDEAV